jgi:hypothetical protein
MRNKLLNDKTAIFSSIHRPVNGHKHRYNRK